MKKMTFALLAIVLSIASFTSCKKVYHCHCTYNNVVVYDKDLGNQTAKSAKDMCSRYDTTGIPGEIWLCTIY